MTTINLPARTNVPPVHEHDCDNCIHLGVMRTVPEWPMHRWDYDADDGEGVAVPVDQVDLYVCPGDTWGPTFVVRYGVDGDYSSYSLDLALREPERWGRVGNSLLRPSWRSPYLRRAVALWVNSTNA